VDLGGGPGFDATLSTDGLVVPAGVAADGSGGAFTWLASALTPGVPNILNHVSTTGVCQVTPGPGISIANGTIAALDVDPTGHAFTLLGPPGRNGLAVQRYAGDLTHWSSPISVYSPFEQPSAATQVPIGIIASSDATVAWQEGSKVKLQRYSLSGLRWMHTTAVAMTPPVRLAGDGLTGVYLVGPYGQGLTTRHILASGLETGAPGSHSPDLGLSQQRVDAVTVNRSGDLFVASSDAAASHVELMTALGAWGDVGPVTQVPSAYRSAGQDGSGGGAVLGAGGGAGGGAVLWRIANGGSAAEVTFRPRARLIKYGASVRVAGYVTQADSLPAGEVGVTVTRNGAASATLTTQADGFYDTLIAPKTNATWSATAAGASAGEIVIGVMPKLTLALSHATSSTRLTEILSGTVKPNHAGATVRIQKAVGSGWRTVASGRIDSRSRYRVTWSLPKKTASYKLRAMLPAHADHAEGASPTANLRVVIRKG
jgi:hypothetical protein